MSRRRTEPVSTAEEVIGKAHRISSEALGEVQRAKKLQEEEQKEEEEEEEEEEARRRRRWMRPWARDT